MSIFLYDGIALLFILLLAFVGYKKGLFLTLCDLIALFVAFFGAMFLSNLLYQPVGELLAPLLQPAVEEGIVHLFEDSVAPTSALIVEALASMPISGAFAGALAGAMTSALAVSTDLSSVSLAVAEFLAPQIARILLFVLAYAVILILWKIISRILNLAFYLPVLGGLNSWGGLILGILQALFLIYALLWLSDTTGFMEAEIGATYLLRLLAEYRPLDIISLFTN